MTRNRSLTGFGVLIAVAAALLVPPLRASAQQGGRTLTVSPNAELVDGQWVRASWAGFEPNGEVRVRLCAANATSVSDCAADSSGGLDPGDSRLVTNDATGMASTPFIVRAKEVPRTGGGDPFRCDTENPCRLYAFELGGGGAESGFDASASAALSYGLSSLVCPENAHRVAGSGASAARTAIVQWQSETCRPPHGLNLSYATSNSVNGKEAFVEGRFDADFAVTSLGPTEADKQTLAANKVVPVTIPLTAGALVLVYNTWFDLNTDGKPDQFTNLQLSPETAAGVLTGQITNWDDPAIARDNPRYTFPGLPIVPVGRADNSGATWLLSSWLVSTARQTWEAAGESFKGGPTTIFPAKQGVLLRTGTDAVASSVRGLAHGRPENDAGYIGFVYYSEALKLGLPVAALKNAAGEFVKPTTEAVNAALAAGSVAADGAFNPNFQTTDAKAYPMPIVTSVIAPAGGGGPMTDGQRAGLQKFLVYATGDGQKEATERGYVPLPASFKQRSDAGIARLVKPKAPATPGPLPASSAASTAANSGSTERAAATALNGVAPGFGTAAGSVASALPDEVATLARSVQSVVPAPVRSVVKGLLKLLGGGSPPMTVSEMFVTGVALLLFARVLTLINRRRQRQQLRLSGAQS